MSRTMFRTCGMPAFALAAAVAASWTGQAFAQAQTGTGGGANNLGDRDTRTANEKKDDQLMRGICIGCSKP